MLPIGRHKTLETANLGFTLPTWALQETCKQALQRRPPHKQVIESWEVIGCPSPHCLFYRIPTDETHLLQARSLQQQQPGAPSSGSSIMQSLKYNAEQNRQQKPQFQPEQRTFSHPGQLLETMRGFPQPQVIPLSTCFTLTHDDC